VSVCVLFYSLLFVWVEPIFNAVLDPWHKGSLALDGMDWMFGTNVGWGWACVGIGGFGWWHFGLILQLVRFFPIVFLCGER